MATPTDDERLLPAAAMADADLARLSIESWYPPFPLGRRSLFWLPEFTLPGVDAKHEPFEPSPDDVFLASFPKSGTTWLKALAFAVLARDRHPPTDPGHPLRRSSPHECVRFFETTFELAGKDPSPRVLATHLPYQLLPERVTGAVRVVYVCRDPKDALVSGWLFTQKTRAAAAAAAGEDPPPEYTLQEAFELFCEGSVAGGPHWLHVLGYWEASQRRPDKVLFLRYEEMLRDPAGNVRRLAEFLGCPFSGEEMAAGTVDAVVELCSSNHLTPEMAAGTVDAVVELSSSNHLTPEMAARLDRVVAGALEGSEFTFGNTSA